MSAIRRVSMRACTEEVREACSTPFVSRVERILRSLMN